MFSEVVGQSHIVKTIQNGLRQGRLAHAYLFSGPRGVGKTTTARLLARAINCIGNQITSEADKSTAQIRSTGEPCNECRLCKASLDGHSIDIIEIDAASNTGVEDIRTLIENVNYTPIEGRAKIYIVDEVHMLSTHAFNALLKTLEEPPSHIYFCLATTAPQKVPSTILSRCQRFDFRRVSASEIRAHLEHILKTENIEYEIEALEIIARKADGSVRDSLSLLDQVIAFAGGRALRQDAVEVLGEVRLDLYFKALELTQSHSLMEAFRLDTELANHGIDIQDYLTGLQNQIVQILQVKTAGVENADIPTEYRNDYQEMAKRLAEADLIRMLNLAAQAELDVRHNFAPRLRLQLLLLKLATLDRSVDITELLEKLKTGPGFNTTNSNDQTSKAKSNPPTTISSAPTPRANPTPENVLLVSKPVELKGKTNLSDDEILIKAQTEWDDICEDVVHTHNSSGRLIHSGGFPVSYRAGVLRLNFIDAMHLDRVQACRQVLIKALTDRLGPIRIEFAIGEIPMKPKSEQAHFEPTIMSIMQRFDARPVDRLNH